MKKPIIQALIQAQSNFVSSLEDFVHKILYLWIMIESRKPRSKQIRNLTYFWYLWVWFYFLQHSISLFSCYYFLPAQLFLFKRIIWTLSSRQSMVRKLNWIFFPDAGGLANGNMFGNFARWNEPSRGASGGESSKKVDYSLHVSQQPSNTGGGTSSSSFSSFQQNTMTRTFPGESSNGRLHIQVHTTLGGNHWHSVFFSYIG